MTQHDFEERLRAMLAMQAADAPRSEDVERRVLTDVLTERPPRRLRWRTFGAPLVAAGAVAAVVAALVGVEHVRTTAIKETQPAAPPSTSVPAPVVPVPTSPITTSSPTSANVDRLTHFTIADLTWVGPNDGWAIGTADCLTGSGTCSAMAHTTDGVTWRSMSGPAVNVGDVNGCDAPCATNIRFANDRVGYVYGQSAFFMTTNGGASWHSQAGGAYALETLDGNVIRLVADHSGCPGPCNLRVELSDIGATSWTTVTLPGGTINTGTVNLLRTGSDAFVSTLTGSQGVFLPGTLYVSTNDGQTWSRRDDPCATLGSFVTKQVVAAADGSVSVACWNRSSFVILTSVDAGATFTAGPNGDRAPIAAASGSTFLAPGDSGIYRSVDRGGTWHLVLRDSSNGSGQCGFESLTVGRCTSNDRHTIWTTHDAGATWTATTFP